MPYLCETLVHKDLADIILKNGYFRIGADKARVGKEKIRFYDKAGLARAAAANHDLKEIPHVLPPVEAHARTGAW